MQKRGQSGKVKFPVQAWLPSRHWELSLNHGALIVSGTMTLRVHGKKHAGLSGMEIYTDDAISHLILIAEK